MATPPLILQKKAAFERTQVEFEANFRFKQDVHGLERFAAFPVHFVVRYLHALWVCECKDRLLSVYQSINRYEGRFCLELLRDWQNGDTASVAAFLERKLDVSPLASATRHIQEARRQQRGDDLAERLVHGRMVMLNRSMNLLHALDAIFGPADEALFREVRVACMQVGHEPAQVEEQLAGLETPLFSYVPHQLLAQQNMVVMNKLGVDVTGKPPHQRGWRPWRVLDQGEESRRPYAEHVIEGYQELT
jgi:hypothetical protein